MLDTKKNDLSSRIIWCFLSYLTSWRRCWSRRCGEKRPRRSSSPSVWASEASSRSPATTRETTTVTLTLRWCPSSTSSPPSWPPWWCLLSWASKLISWMRNVLLSEYLLEKQTNLFLLCFFTFNIHIDVSPLHINTFAGMQRRFWVTWTQVFWAESWFLLTSTSLTCRLRTTAKCTESSKPWRRTTSTSSAWTPVSWRMSWIRSEDECLHIFMSLLPAWGLLHALDN